jgi:hypothetical protein
MIQDRQCILKVSKIKENETNNTKTDDTPIVFNYYVRLSQIFSRSLPRGLAII